MTVESSATPRLPRHVRLRFDSARDAWVLLAPERVLFPDSIAVEILKRCDGESSVAAIAAQLSQEFETSVETVEGDVVELLQELADKGLLEL